MTVMAEEPKRHPMMYEPDPAMTFKAERVSLERRVGAFIIVRESSEGHTAETRLSGGVTPGVLRALSLAQRMPETARRVQ